MLKNKRPTQQQVPFYQNNGDVKVHIENHSYEVLREMDQKQKKGKKKGR